MEAGPQDGSLLVTWCPVTVLDTGGLSNGALVTGYRLYLCGGTAGSVESSFGVEGGDNGGPVKRPVKRTTGVQRQADSTTTSTTTTSATYIPGDDIDGICVKIIDIPNCLYSLVKYFYIYFISIKILDQINCFN